MPYLQQSQRTSQQLGLPEATLATSSSFDGPVSIPTTERAGTPTPTSNPTPGVSVEDVDYEPTDNKRESKKAKASVAMSERLAHIRAKTKQVLLRCAQIL